MPRSKEKSHAPPMRTRPMPPEGIGKFDGATFSPAYVPAHDMPAWVNATFIDKESALHNPDHAHLEGASIRYLWAGEPNSSKGRQIIGQTEEVLFRAGKWVKGRQEQQMVEWFGEVPDYLITLDANYCAECSDMEFCALVEHELFHIAQERDEFGGPKFRKDGTPALEIRGHDVEEFVGVVRRYGVGHSEGALARLVAAANAKPEVAKIDIARACGTCLARVA